MIEQCLSELREAHVRFWKDMMTSTGLRRLGVLAFGGICVRSGISWRLLSFIGAQTRDLLFPF